MKSFILPAVTLAGLVLVAASRADAAEIAQQAPRALLSKTALAWPLGEPQDANVKVVVDYVIEPNGTVDHLKVEPGPDRAYAKQARETVRRFVYSPAQLATTGRAVAIFDPAH
jgi:hypothetical protein